jgi:phage tail tape-measure protein
MDELSKQNTANALDNMGKGAALGASVGSLFPGLGTVIGGVAGGLIGGITSLFGGSSRKAKLRARIRAAQAQVENNNSYSLASAHSDYLQNQYNLEHENTQDDQLFAAKHGKDLVQPIRNK